jgi:putative phosphoesterase
MVIGVISDTHNNQKNIRIIIDILNKELVDTVIHTGDICNQASLELFSQLDADLVGVFGNNDRSEIGLKKTSENLHFFFQEPPLNLKIKGRKIAVFHEPDHIDGYLRENNDLDLVLHGHTHRYRKDKINDTYIFNPGESAGFVKGKNAIGTVDLNNMEIKRIFF